MRFLFAGIAAFLLLGFILGQIFTPKRTPIRKVLAKGFYLTSLVTLGLGFLVGIGALVYYGFNNDGRDMSGPLAGMSETQKEIYLDSLYDHPPQPSIVDLRDVFVDYRFGTTALPCFESVHNLDVVSLNQIVSLEKVSASRAEKIYEIELLAELKTNKPYEGFHLRGNFSVQYRFYRGSREQEPGWGLSKIFVSNCEVLSKREIKSSIGQDSLYPGLKRDVKP